MKDIYRIVFQDYKDCFLRISLNITKENEYAKMVYGTANTAYFSIINGKVKDSGDGSAYIGLNAVYAKQLGLAQDELVTVTYLKSLPKLHTVHSVHRRGDLDVLVLSKDKLEDNILRQIKVVWPGQAFPVWIGKNFYFNIKIEFLAPPSSVGILCEGTELDLRPQDDLNALKSLDYPLKENVVSNISTEPVEFRVCEMPLLLGEDPNSLSALVFTSNWPNCWGEIICDMWCTLSYIQGETAVEASLKGVHTSPNQSQVTRSRNLLVNKTVMTALGLTGNGYNVNVTLHGPTSKNQLPVPASAPQQNAVPKEPVFSGGLLTLVNEGEASLELALRLTPNAANFHPNGILHLSHNVLVVGDRGSGRTTLAKEIIKRLSGIPHFVHVETVSCRSIVGKRPDACGRILGSALDRCFLCEPSILFLDDLECIAPHITPNEEATAEGFHNARMGELLSSLIWEAGGHNGRGAGKVAVLATAHSPAALSASLVSPRGTHIFTTILSIPNLETDIRQKMLLAMLGCDSDKTNNNTLEKAIHDIALRTAGFVATDLTDLVHRAIFDALGRKAYEKTDVKETKPEVMLDNDNLDEEKEMGPHGVRVEDLESALSRTVPLSLHGTELVRWGENGKGEKVGGLWEDIGGLKEAKKKLEEAVLWPLKHPQLFKNLPLKPRRGMLLYGPPGTGKTRLVSSLVGHCGLRLINVKGPELLSKYIGASEEAVRNIFKKAYSARPCILFFDEFESLAPRRGHDSTGVTDRVVNQLLTQLDGVEEGVGDGMCVIAATTRPDLIDPALLRPGRLDSPILCPMPDEEDRISILHKLSHRLLLGKGVDLNELAKLTDGFTGADLQAVLYSSQLVSLKSGCNQDYHKHNKGLIVEWDQILQALKNTRPSLTKREVDKYERCYASLDGSGDFPIPDQKVSLA